MKIAIDGGALCGKRGAMYGNYIVTRDICSAISSFWTDEDDIYTYTFCKQREKSALGKRNTWVHIGPKWGWMSVRVQFEEIKRRSDIFLALQQASPFFVRGRIITLVHGLAYMRYPQYYSKTYTQLIGQIKRIINRNDTVLVSSERVRDELIQIGAQDERINVLPFGVPFDMLTDGDEEKITIPEGSIILYAGMGNEIKNIQGLVGMAERWGSGTTLILAGVEKRYSDSNNIVSIGHVKRSVLKYLYRRADALISASFYESFNLPIVEAIAQGCPVVATEQATIPELRPYVNVVSNLNEMFGVIRSGRAMRNSRHVKFKKEVKNNFTWKGFIRGLERIVKNTKETAV